MDKFIITISREYGSGGRHVGGILAKELNLPFYDKSIIQMVSEKSGLSEGFIEKSDENIPSSFLHNFKYSAYSGFDIMAYYDSPITDVVFIAQSAVIKDLASKESCVIVGRCADYILRDTPGLITIFIRGTVEDRIRHAVDYYDLPTEKAAERIKKIDKSRANYYKYYTSRPWGSIDNFDLVFNTSMTGVNGAAAIIKTMLREKGLV